MKLEDALIHSYAMLVIRGRCKITDVPEEYRSEVRDFVAIDMQEEADEDIEFVIDDKGPLTLPKLEFTVKSGSSTSCKLTDFFTEEVLNGKAMPSDVKFDLVRVEPQVAFEEAPKMYIIPTDVGFNVRVTGKPIVQVHGMPSVIGVVSVKSSDYEDMNLSLYASFEE